jgi:hypothetical protein
VTESQDDGPQVTPAAAQPSTGAAGESADPPRPPLGRISVNVTPATQAALQLLAESEGVTVTEALRRLVGYGTLIYDNARAGHRVLIDRGGGRIEQIVLIDNSDATPPRPVMRRRWWSRFRQISR